MLTSEGWGAAESQKSRGGKLCCCATASYGTFSHKFWFILKNMTCFRVSLYVALEWYITFLIKQWCKALKGGYGISWLRYL